MAFNIDNLVCFATGVGSPDDEDPRKLWFYQTNDLLSLVDDSGYFNDAVAKGMNNGDLIFVSGDLDGTEATNILIVNSAPGAATVTVTGLATVTLTYNARYVMNTTITLTDGDSGYVVAPYAGTISAIYTVLLGGAVTTNNATCTFKIGAAGAGVAITNGVVTVTAAGSAIGDVDSASPTANNTVAAGNLVYCSVSNTPGGSRTAFVSLLVDAAT